MKQKNLKSLALGAAIAGSLAAVSVAQASPFSLTTLGSAIEPYLRQIAQTVDDARKTAQTLAGVGRPSPTILSSLQESGSP